MIRVVDRVSLKDLLDRERVRPDAYALDRDAQDEALCLQPNEGGWIVFYSERGNRIDDGSRPKMTPATSWQNGCWPTQIIASCSPEPTSDHAAMGARGPAEMSASRLRSWDGAARAMAKNQGAITSRPTLTTMR